MNRMSKKRVLFLLGGRSGEHEISLISGKHILQALDRSRYEPLLVIIQKDGVMTLGNEAEIVALPNNPKKLKTPSGQAISIRPYFQGAKAPMLVAGEKNLEFDIAFPVLHGPGGEDGTIQGLFELARIPVVGCGVKASALCMDKAMTKKICLQADLPVVHFVETYRGEPTPSLSWDYPVFVKPAHLGSSLGVSKVKSKDELKPALEAAFSMDSKVMIEKGIVGRELEIAVLGKRGALVVSPAGEVKMQKAEFYSYDAKYVDEDSAQLIIPAPLSPSDLQRLQNLSRDIFSALDCHGMARIDFFMTESGEFLLNEVNTIPGFTPISMYPKLLGLAGISYPDLITRLIELADV